MLHSSVILGRMMIVYGGTNRHHENIKEHEKKCYSDDVLVYNIGKCVFSELLYVYQLV